MPKFYTVPLEEALSWFIPIFDGTYEDGQGTHDTWRIPSFELLDLEYVVDVNTSNADIICTCPANMDYKKMCKHIRTISSTYELVV